MSFQLSCESTVDLPYEYVHGRGMEVLFYSYTVNGVDYPDDMGRDPEAMKKFYERLASGIFSKTSQISTYRYTEYFENLLKQGDVLHIAFGSGMTQSVNNAWAAVETSHKKLQIAHDAIAQAEENLRLNKDYYRVGTTKMTDLLLAQEQYQQARDRYTDAYAALQTKILEYRQATGQQ